MIDNDFRDYAEPWLDQLRDDPNQTEPPNLANTTTFPSTDYDWNDNQLSPLKDDENSDVQAASDSVTQNEDTKAARDARPMAGLDVLAFYKSFRFINRTPFRGRWGIFLLDAGINGLTDDLLSLSPSIPYLEVRKFATDILLTHERYHFWIDTWALGQEITPLTSHPVKRYEYYFSGKRSIELTPDDWEESLANHYVFKKLSGQKFSNGQYSTRILREILLDAPSPYSDFLFDATERTRKEGVLATAIANGKSTLLARVIGMLVSSKIDPSVLSASIQQVDRRHPVVGVHRCPTYQVRTSGYAALVAPFQGPKLKELEKFVTKYLDGVQTEFTDHAYYRIDNGRKVKFPNPHDSEARGYELKGMLHKAGMTMKEFNEASITTDKWSKNCPRNPAKPPLGES